MNKFTEIFNFEKFQEAWGFMKQYITKVVNAAKGAAIDASEVKMTQSSSADYAGVYTLTQGTNTIGVINIPKDLVVVQDGSGIVTATASNPITVDGTEYKSGKFVSLKIQNQTDPVYISVQELVDVYTAEQNAAQVQLRIDSATNVIGADIKAGSIGTTELSSEVNAILDKVGTNESAISSLTSKVESLETDAVEIEIVTSKAIEDMFAADLADE